MTNALNDEALDQIFRKARTHNAWLDKPVTDETLLQLFELLKWGPTSANRNPRGLFSCVREKPKRDCAAAPFTRKRGRRRWPHRSQQ